MARHKGTPKALGSKKPTLTHFLCLPLVTKESRPQLEAAMQQLRDAVVVTDATTISATEKAADAGAPEQNLSDPGIHPKAIRPVSALHCTLGVMSLDEDRLAQAVATLKALDVRSILEGRHELPSERKHIEQASRVDQPDTAPASLERPISPPPIERQIPPLKIDLRGLVSMHAPHKTSILYTAPTDTSDRLYPFCLAVQKVFADAGYLVADDRKLKLHATIINTIYAKGRKKRPPRPMQREETPERDGIIDEDPGGEPSAKTENADAGGKSAPDDRSQGHGPNANAPLKINATALLERFKAFVWAENVVLDRIAICEMGAKKIIDGEGRVVNEEYTEVASVPLPTGDL